MCIKCEKCNDFILDDTACLWEFYKIGDEFYCSECIENMKHEPTTKINRFNCSLCGESLNRSDTYYKINNDFYCVDCINHFRKDGYTFN